VDTYLEGIANGQGVKALQAASVRDIIFWTCRDGPRHPWGLHTPKAFALATQYHARERHPVGFHDLLGVSCCAGASVLRLHPVGNHQLLIRSCAHAQHNMVKRSHASLSLILVLRSRCAAHVHVFVCTAVLIHVAVALCLAFNANSPLHRRERQVGNAVLAEPHGRLKAVEGVRRVLQGGQPLLSLSHTALACNPPTR
jgi:hypothetical protein